MPPAWPVRLALAVLAVLASSGAAAAQTQTVLFPGQSGADLLAAIRAQYRPPSLLSYSGAQDRLMDTVDRTTQNGQAGVVCVYTGYFVRFDGVPSSDPNQDIFNNGSGLNVEHTWPRSLMSGNPGPESDMHHLFPTQVQANNDRATFRFAEIPDPLTTRWYRGGPPYTQVGIPAANIDEYSELRSGTSFEPREDHKGDVARALFYMSAVYPVSTSGLFPFDATDRRTLYDWHRADPISAENQARSARVATFQSGRDNPFVLDSTLVRRAFFPGIVVSEEPLAEAAAPRLRLAGRHPFAAEARLALELPAPAAVRAEAFDALGRRVALLFDGDAPAGTLALALDGRALAPGVYTVRASVSVAGGGTAALTRRLVRAR